MSEPAAVEFPAGPTEAGMSFGVNQERILMGALSLLSQDDRQAFAAAVRRRTFGGRRDLMKVLGYSENPQFQDFWTRYERQDIAGRIIDLPVDQTWGGGDIVIDEWPEWERLNRRLEVQARMTEVDRLSSIGRYAVLLIGVKEQNAPDTVSETAIAEILKQPVDKLSSLDDILYLQQYSEEAVSIESTNSNPTSPRFGKPELYEISISTGLQTRAGGGKKADKKTTIKVHHSRVLHVTPNRTVSDVYGTSRLLRVLDRLEDLDKVVGGSAEMFWLGADAPMVLSRESAGGSTGANSAGTAAAKDDVRAQAEEVAHGLRRFFSVTNGSLEKLESNQPDPTGIVSSIISLLSAGSDIPARILIGSERGELASTQDRDNFADTITNRRSNYAQPQILKAFLRRLHEWGQCEDPAGFSIHWPPIQVLGATERSENDERKVKSMAEAEKSLVLSGGIAFSAADFRLALGFEGAPPSDGITGVNTEVDEADPDVQAAFDQARQPTAVS